MRFSRDWLADYVDLPADAGELAATLTAVGLAVEGREEADGDVLLEVEVTSNRADCMNHLGLARELGAATGTALRQPAVDPPAPVPGAGSEAGLPISTADAAGCPRYVGVVLRGVSVGPSPDWLRQRLEAVGVRPVNNVVDVTNFVLWELGQPLHAFDLERLAGPEIIVRRARAGERLVTLDGIERELSERILVIADRERAVAVAGVMGGADSEVGPGTTDVLIESAHFARRAVRDAAVELGLATDASHRFERGVDPEGCLAAAWRAAGLITELAGGSVEGAPIEARGELPAVLAGALELARLEAFAGVSVPADFVAGRLAALGFGVESRGPERWRVTVPSWRLFDFETDGDGEVYPAHFYEEVLRLFGYDRVPATLPAAGRPDAGSSGAHLRRRQVRGVVAASGYAETVSFAFGERAAAERYAGPAGDGAPVELENPVSEQYSVLRRSLLPGLVDGARFNQRRGRAAVRLFEIGNVFTAERELEALGVVAGGGSELPWSGERPHDLFDVKGVVEELAARFAARLEFRPTALGGFLVDTAAEIVVGGRAVGALGQIDDPELTSPLYGAELAIEVLAGGARRAVVVPTRHPGVAVDLTLTHPRRVRWAQIEARIRAAGVEDLAAFELADRYDGKGVPAGAVNTTIHFIYESDARSLTREEVHDRHRRLSAELDSAFGLESKNR